MSTIFIKNYEIAMIKIQNLRDFLKWVNFMKKISLKF